MARTIYRLCMYGWTISAAGWFVIAVINPPVAVQAIIVCMVCVLVAGLFWYAGEKV